MRFFTVCAISFLLTAAALAQTAKRPAAPSPTISIQVTDHSGNPLAEVAVTVTGPVERSGSTGSDGTIAFRSMRQGTYRLRFEREGFVTLERDVTMRAQPADVSAALTAAPMKPVATVPPLAPPPRPPARTPRAVEPRTLSLIDWVERNLIGGEAVKSSLLACAEGGTTRLLQVRDPLPEQQHSDADEIIYVIAGAGFVRVKSQDTKVAPGWLALIPRGVAHSMRRDGRNPLIVLSVMAGAPCTDTSAPAR